MPCRQRGLSRAVLVSSLEVHASDARHGTVIVALMHIDRVYHLLGVLAILAVSPHTREQQLPDLTSQGFLALAHLLLMHLMLH